ncbi:TRAP transporter small permease [Rhodobium gokarnense]|uniref:TRAP transporter small permease protein n=1 Tax=Rhodobium gokarnense TaxID=364296 RepID=A0ABT3HGA5_9HYPH|nr:TRAP transporter small permease subunit [Rhodobium gokarnense]MCW2309410.1 TRAP-type C4-dicarboxylate transport system permease small subunit [Rhodobium gokarnense]
MTRISRLYERILAFGAGLMMFLVFAIIFVNSMRRYTTGRSLEWGEELPIYLMIYGVMFGIGLAYLNDRHIRFALVTDILPEAWTQKLFAATDIVTMVTGAALAWSGILFAMRRPHIDASGLIGSARALADSTGLAWLEWIGHVGTWQSAIAIGGVLLALAALIRFLTRLQEIRAGVQDQAA